jgi:hypothetical protein
LRYDKNVSDQQLACYAIWRFKANNKDFFKFNPIETWTLNTQQGNKLLATEMDFGEDLLENQGKKRSEMSPLERSWRRGRTF